MTDDERKALLERADRERERALIFLGPASSNASTGRSIGFTLVAALVGFSLTQTSWPLAALAAVLTLIFWVLDGYHTERENEVYARLTDLEAVARFEYAMCKPGAKPDTAARLDRRLMFLRIGVVRDARNFKVRDVWYQQPFALFRFLYPMMLVALVLATVLLALRSPPSEDPPWQHEFVSIS